MRTVRCINYKSPTAFLFLFAMGFFTIVKVVNKKFDVSQAELPSMTEEDDDFIVEYSSDDPRLLDHIRKYYLDPPSSGPLHLVDSKTIDHSQYGQSMVISGMLNHKRGGIFMEVGAYDGETYSNSLYFERYLNWTGLLIEADPANLFNLRQRNRNAWILKGCVDGGDRPIKRKFLGALDVGSIAGQVSPIRWIQTILWRPTRTTEVWCFPSSSIFKAAGITEVDYAVIDVEGAEMDVLRSLPLDEVKFGILQVEYAVCSGTFWDRTRSSKRKLELQNYVKEKLPNYDIVRYIGLDMVIQRRPDS